MALTKVTYVDETTLIEAQNLNDIQDEIINNTVPKTGGTYTGSITVDKADGTTSTQGWSSLFLGNSTPTGTNGNSAGDLQVYGRTGYKTEFVSPAGSPTANRVINIPDANGTLALAGGVQEGTVDSTNVSAGFAKYEVIGSVAVVTVRLEIANAISSTVDLVTNLPHPAGGYTQIIPSADNNHTGQYPYLNLAESGTKGKLMSRSSIQAGATIRATFAYIIS